MDTITDPGERTRREQEAYELSKDAQKSRYETMRMLISLEYEVKDNRKELKEHIGDDKVVQVDIRDAIKELHSRIGGVTSNVGDLQSDRDKVLGIKEATITLAKALTVIVAAAWAVWVTFFKGNP